jgi:hypothetical protein
MRGAEAFRVGAGAGTPDAAGVLAGTGAGFSGARHPRRAHVDAAPRATATTRTAAARAPPPDFFFFPRAARDVTPPL